METIPERRDGWTTVKRRSKRETVIEFGERK
jgi:hypothetical protein